MNDKTKFAALILGFRREQGVLDVINSCARNGIEKIYLSLDGEDLPQNVLNQNILISRAKYAANNCGIRLLIQTHPKHIGLRKAVLSGIDWFFCHENAGIVLEDDLEISDDFFRFVHFFISDALNENILLISGNATFEHGSSSLTNYPLVWGWGTTSRNWKLMKSLIMDNGPSTPKVNQNVELRVRNYWLAGKWRVNAGIVDSWAISLAAAMRLGGFKAIIPPVNLVSNRGYDSSATHTQTGSPGLSEPTKNLSNSHFNYLDTSPETMQLNNKYLETYRYKIRFRSYFAPLKALFELLKIRTARNFICLRVNSDE